MSKKQHTKGRIRRTRKPCSDCGKPLADGGSVGLYCTTPGCGTLEKAAKEMQGAEARQEILDLAVERRARETVLHFPETSQVNYRVVTSTKDIQSLLRLLDRARLNTKVKKP